MIYGVTVTTRGGSAHFIAVVANTPAKARQLALEFLDTGNSAQVEVEVEDLTYLLNYQYGGIAALSMEA